jgi:nitrile hydratase
VDGIHDLGGKQGFGPVDGDDPGVGFHDAFEARVFGISVAAQLSGAAKNVDQFRHAIERIDPVGYLTHGYYGRWLGGLETLFVESGLLRAAEIDAAVVARGGAPAAGRAARPSASPDAVPASEAPRATAERKTDTAPRFAVGDRVRTRAHGSAGHTRLPAYARDRVGVVAACHGPWVYPDTNAHGGGECPQHLYTVCFDGAELWGDAGEAAVRVALDLFEPYLETA